jgi:hypothetical protein
MANILALVHVQKVCGDTLDSSAEVAIIVPCLDGTTMTFQEHPTRLYVYKLNVTNTAVGGYAMVSTGANQKHFFACQEIKATDAAWELYHKIRRPSDVEFQQILQNNVICNCPFTVRENTNMTSTNVKAGTNIIFSNPLTVGNGTDV